MPLSPPDSPSSDIDERGFTLPYRSKIQVVNSVGGEQEDSDLIVSSPSSENSFGSQLPGNVEQSTNVADSYDQYGDSVISTLHSKNLQALQTIQPFLRTDAKANFEQEIGRFRVWGCSLFAHPLSLDIILRQSQKGIGRLRACIIGTLGDMALIAVRLLHSLAEPDNKLAQRTINQLQACFGHLEEVNLNVLEIPDSFYDDIFEEEDIAPTSILEKQLTALIDCLFDMLLAISRIRQTYLLNLEREEEISKRMRNTVPIRTRSSEHQVIPPYKLHDPVVEMLTMDLELAEAIKASLASNQVSENMELDEDRSIMEQIEGWETEISQLKLWSKAFEQSLDPSPSDAEIGIRMAVFESLVKIGCVFASVSPKNISGQSLLADQAFTEERIKRMVASMPHSRPMDLKIDFHGKSPRDALNALSQTNKALPVLY